MSERGGAPAQVASAAARRRLAWVLAITLVVLAVEAVGGFLTGSLTLLADAGHMLSDASAVGLALFAAWFASRPSPPRHTYGYQRAEILAALLNALLLALVCLFVVLEAIRRIREPLDIDLLPMFILGCLGLAGNLAGMRLLHHHAHTNLNVRGAYLEVFADMLASVGVLAAAALTYFFSWKRADAVISLGIALFILPRIFILLREATEVLLESAPRGMDVDAVRRALEAEADVVAVHDLHVWTIASGRVCLSAHIVSRTSADRDRLLKATNQVLRDRFGVGHTTLQVEGESRGDPGGDPADEVCDPCDASDPTPVPPGQQRAR